MRENDFGHGKSLGDGTVWTAANSCLALSMP